MKGLGGVPMFSKLSQWFQGEMGSGRVSRGSLPARRRPFKPCLEVLEGRNLLSFWSTVAAMPTARWGLAATTGTDGRIYAIGGYNNGFLSTVEAYDPGTNTWTTRASMRIARYGQGAATGPDGRIYVCGG